MTRRQSRAAIDAELLRLRRELALLKLQRRKLARRKEKEGAGDGKQS